MTYLLDSHALIWLLSGDRQLSPVYDDLIAPGQSTAVFSVVSLWEMAIKVSLRKLELAVPIEEVAEVLVRQYRLELLPIAPRHVARVAKLPMHHRDPFDRMLVAQAIEERLCVVSRDTALDAYGIERIW